MATMVLTAVGGVVGGPVGGAIGSLVGQYLDREVIFRPGRREGARLADLRIQASSYGVAIPLVFGTMRVAGSVIWATDLVERRSDSRAGKGSPAVGQYSYAASFAVLVSGRPIRRVGRVWADGKLLRGAGGDLKAAGVMRVHYGDEDQPPDPLIASAEGAAAPAHRGMAYVVFEALALADFGNRIPSLSFEVIADEGPIDAGGVARALAPEITGALPLALDGFAAEGDAGSVVAALAAAAGGWVAADRGALRLGSDAAPVAVISDAGAGIEGAVDARGRTVAALTEVPRIVGVSHYDPARDWQAGNQRAVRAGAGRREQRVAMPAALSPAAAKRIAATLLARSTAERVRRTVAPGLAGWALRPGMVVAVAGESGRWRVDRVAIERMAATATLVPLAPATQAAPAAGGRAVTAADLPAGRTILNAAELPPVDGIPARQPRISVATAGTGAGWRNAALLVSLDDGASWNPAGATALPAVVGTLAMRAAADATTIEVKLAHDGMMLTTADAAALDRGANLALVGDELLQFGDAAMRGEGGWRIGALRRGRFGTADAMGTQAEAARFVLMEPASTRGIDLPPGAIGRTVRVMAAGVGDGDGPPVTMVAVSGISTALVPPTELSASANPEGILVRWQRGGGADTRARFRILVDRVDGRRLDTIVGAESLLLGPEWTGGGPLAISVSEVGDGTTSGATLLLVEDG